MKKAVFAFLVCLGSLLFTNVLNAQSQQKNVSEMEQIEKNAPKLQLNVEGMSCQAGCADGIDNMLRRQEGVVKSKTTYATGTSVIWYNEKLISEKKIIDLINERGFKARITKDNHKKENE